jgi:ankyrin repeat protein
MGVCIYQPGQPDGAVSRLTDVFCRLLAARLNINMFDDFNTSSDKGAIVDVSLGTPSRPLRSVSASKRGGKSRGTSSATTRSQQQLVQQPRGDQLATMYAVMSAVSKGDIGGLIHMYHAGNASVHWCDYDRKTALHVAAVKGDVEVCRLLIGLGGDVLAADKFGRTPQGIAESGNNTELITVMSEGVDVTCATSLMACPVCNKIGA